MLSELSPENICIRCGAQLREETPEGALCADCLRVEAEKENTPTAIGSTPFVNSRTFTMPSATPEPAAMQVLGDFEIHSKLGQGGMGAVYRARQMGLDRFVALKVLPAQYEEDEDFVARFRREAAVAASLNHPNLVRVFASGVAEGCHYIAMELVEGQNLRQRLKQTGPMAPSEALLICLEVARGLQFGWQRAQLIHRDIKPSNIYLSQAGEVKLGDLGLAKSLLSDATGVTHTGTALGTPHYVSPEQARGEKNIDFRADIYSLGCTLFQMLTGRTPYEATDPLSVMNLHVSGPPPAISKVLPGCPIPLARLVGKMLLKPRQMRPQSYEELIEQMKGVLGTIQTGESDPGAEAKPLAVVEPMAAESATKPAQGAVRHSPKLKRKVPLYAGLMVGLLILGAVTWALSRTQSSQRPQGAAAQSIGPVKTEKRDRVALPSKIEARAIRLWDSLDKLPLVAGITWENNSLRLDGKALSSALESRDGVLRATIQANPGSGATLGLRTGEAAQCRLSMDYVGKTFYCRASVSGPVIANWPFPRSYAADEWFALEMRLIGDKLTVLVDGKVLGVAQSEAWSAPGKALVYAGRSGYFRDIVYFPLDGVPEAEAL